jgi:NAD(P)-dependent dehydrogenase (short-subunit alcohol dehydrogenase family)
MDLVGKVALVTGAARGIGWATVQRLAAEGATVVGLDVDDELGAARFDDLGAPHRYIHLDVGDAGEWERVVAAVVAETGGIDIVHLNAGISSRPRGVPALDDPFTWMTLERYRQVMAVNVDGVALGVLAALPHLVARAGDVIVTASIDGLITVPMDPVYGMSKSAVISYVVNMAPLLESKGVRINVICPGAIDTDMMPPDIRGMPGLTMAPSSFIADVVVKILESRSTGQTYVAISDAPGGLWLHEFAHLPMEQLTGNS